MMLCLLLPRLPHLRAGRSYSPLPFKLRACFDVSFFAASLAFFVAIALRFFGDETAVSFTFDFALFGSSPGAGVSPAADAS